MKTQVSFADVVFSSVSFSEEDDAENLILKLIDTQWFQRLRDISQTANTRLVYMFSEHSRFGHSVGVAYLSLLLIKKLLKEDPAEVQQYRTAVLVAALLHDVGHLAPGSHTAYRTWFPKSPDVHEEISRKIILEDPEIRSLLDSYDSDLATTVVSILAEDTNIPPWTWQCISGGGWNADRGNWCIVDSILAGVKYGQYNIAALTDSITLTNEHELALKENRLDAMMHFAISRHAMYRQLYQHRVLMACDRLNFAIAERARDISDSLEFCDPVMKIVLKTDSPLTLSLDTLFAMTECWWRYHLMQWRNSSDSILADLSSRLLRRDLLKTVRIHNTDNKLEILSSAKNFVTQAGFNPKYYLHDFSISYMHKGDKAQSMKVLMDNGTVQSMLEADPLYQALLKETENPQKTWIALPKEAKLLMKKER